MDGQMALINEFREQKSLTQLIGQATRAQLNESYCGDYAESWIEENIIWLALADGLGHGVFAYQAAQAAIQTLRIQRGHSLTERFAIVNEVIRDTRGVALAVVRIDRQCGVLQHGAVGNVRTVIVNPIKTQRLSGSRGIVGAGYTGFHPEEFQLQVADWVMLYSDGIPENAELDDILHQTENLNYFTPELIAKKILERWQNPRDDTSILVYCHSSWDV